jgi:thioredoxin reductase (NADPH)
VAATGLFVLIGAVPRTEWLPPEIQRDRSGYLLTGSDLVRDGRLVEGWTAPRAPLGLETSMPRVFAIGDVRHGSTKRVAAGVGDGSVVMTEIYRLSSTEAER